MAFSTKLSDTTAVVNLRMNLTMWSRCFLIFLLASATAYVLPNGNHNNQRPNQSALIKPIVPDVAESIRPSAGGPTRQGDEDEEQPIVPDMAGSIRPSAGGPTRQGAADDEEEEYRRKLAAAEIAIQEAQEARQKLLWNSKEQDVVVGNDDDLFLPTLGRSSISYTDAGTMQVEVEPSGMDPSVVFGGAFSLAWFSVVIPATLASAGTALFMLPFWAAGGMVAKGAMVDPFVRSSLAVGQYAWSITKTFSGRTFGERQGPTQELLAAVAEVGTVVNDKPQWHLKLITKKGGDVTFGTGLSEEELVDLAEEINRHLKELRIVAGKDNKK